MNRTSRFIALAGLLALAGPCLAGQTVDETRPAAADGRIEFKAVSGRFEVIGHDSDQWQLSGELGDDVAELVIDGDRDHWTIEIRMKQGGFGWGMGKKASDLELRVPHGVELSASTVSGDLMLRNLDGRSVDVRTVSGDLALSAVRPANLDAKSVSGDLSADTGGSEVNRLNSVSGDLKASGLRGRIEMQSVSGDVTISGRMVSELAVESVSGEIEARIVPAERARVDLSSHSGDVELYLPESIAVRVEAKTFSGNIASDFGGQVQSGRGPGESLSMNGPAAKVEIEAASFSGNVRIRHLDDEQAIQ